jgi:hypothetical protein
MNIHFIVRNETLILAYELFSLFTCTLAAHIVITLLNKTNLNLEGMKPIHNWFTKTPPINAILRFE